MTEMSEATTITDEEREAIIAEVRDIQQFINAGPAKEKRRAVLVRRLRDEVGMNVHEIAEVLGIAGSTVYRVLERTKADEAIPLQV